MLDIHFIIIVQQRSGIYINMFLIALLHVLMFIHHPQGSLMMYAKVTK